MQDACHGSSRIARRARGVRPFGRGYVEQIGGDYVSVNVGALDNASDDELANTPVQFMNGRDNDWFSAPRETRYL